MARNLIICCDGTANEFKTDPTNVLKFAFAAAKGDNQTVYYHPGLGTRAPAGLFTSVGRWIARLAGKAFGYGLKADIADVYTFVMDQYRAGDQIYIFGFSRGAYTARALVALIWQYGLIGQSNGATVPYAIDLLWSCHGLSAGELLSKCFRRADTFRQTLSVGPCPIRFLGVWDTVSSVGWVANPLSLPFTHKLPGVSVIRHAVAIDERRAFFRTNLVEQGPGRDIQEVWFPGVHCDVGGGYPEGESQLAKVALQWMIEEAQAAGMEFDSTRMADVLGNGTDPYVRPDPSARMHNSLLPFWWIAEFIPKRRWNSQTANWEWRLNFFRRRKMGDTPIVHDGAWARGDSYVKRLPPQSVRWSSVPRFESQPAASGDPAASTAHGNA